MQRATKGDRQTIVRSVREIAVREEPMRADPLPPVVFDGGLVRQAAKAFGVFGLSLGLAFLIDSLIGGEAV